MADQQSEQNQGSGRQQQQGGQSGQQQQFDSGTRQPGSGGDDGNLADRIRPHQQVVDQSGARIGTVDHVDGDRIKLTRDSSGDHEHHYVPLNQVAGIEGDQIRLRDRGDTSFGVSGGN